MPTRLIVDGSMNAAITYYQNFPTEPTINPTSDLTLLRPIPQADRLRPITLLALLNRMVALPADERQLLIITHGTEEGLSIPLVQGTDFRASAEVLHILRVLGGAVTEARRIGGLPEAERPAAWLQMVRGLRYFDGTAMYPDLPEQTDAVYRQMFEYLLTRTAGGQAPLPQTNPPLDSWDPTPLDGVGRQNLNQLLARGNEARGRYDRIDFRGCNIGRSTTNLAEIRAFFGCQVVVAPDTVAFDGHLTVTVDAAFDQNFDNNSDQATRQAIFDRRGNVISGRQPVRLDSSDQEEAVAIADMPRTRRFDADSHLPEAEQRSGDEVFIRLWMTSAVDDAGNPHHTYFGWLRAISRTYVEMFVQNRVAQNIAHWSNRGRLPLVGLWLQSDQGVQLPNSTEAFALPRDPEYLQHLVSDPPANP